MQTSSLELSQQRLALLQAVGKVLNTLPQDTKNLQGSFTPFGTILAEALQFDTARLLILDRSQNNVQVIIDWPSAALSTSKEPRKNVTLSENQFVGNDKMLQEALLQKKCYWNLSSTESVCESMCFANNTATKTSVILPLTALGQNTGTLSLEWVEKLSQEIRNHYELLLQDIAMPLTHAIENTQLLIQSQQQATQQFLLNDITQSIRQSLEIKQILQTLVEKLQETLRVDRVYTSVTTAEQGVIYFQACAATILPVTEPVTQSTQERSIFSRRSLTPDNTNPYVIHALNKSDTLSNNAQIKSIAIFPLTGSQADGVKTLPLIGTLSLHQINTQRAWTDEDITLVQAVCEQVCVALNQAELFETTRQQKLQLEKTLQELNQTQLQLIQSEKMAVIGQFVAGIAHDVNTPLAIITANQDTASQYLDRIGNLDEASINALEQAKSLLEHNHQAALRIRDIVDNLRNFARLDESDRKIANIHTGLDSTLLLLESQFKERQIEITTLYDANLPSIECFPGLLNQVFQNLLVNAMQAFDEAIPNKQIIISTQHNAQNNLVEIQISDNGKGISEDHLARVFDPGFTTKGVGVGTGLGLALCYKIIEKHGGNLIVESKIDSGSIFKIVLPSV